jgi:hypothetical protein
MTALLLQLAVNLQSCMFRLAVPVSGDLQGAAGSPLPGQNLKIPTDAALSIL